MTEIEQVLIDRFRLYIEGGDDGTIRSDYLAARMDYLAQPGNTTDTLAAFIKREQGR